MREYNQSHMVTYSIAYLKLMQMESEFKHQYFLQTSYNRWLYYEIEKE